MAYFHICLAVAWLAPIPGSAMMSRAERRAPSGWGCALEAPAAPEPAEGGSVQEVLRHVFLRHPEHGRYLLYEPQFGVSNQLMGLVSAVHWAAALNRTLLLPPILAPRASSFDPNTPTRDWPSTEDLFDLQFLNEVQLPGEPLRRVDLVEHGRWWRTGAYPSPARVLLVGREPTYDEEGNASMLDLLQGSRPRHLPTVNLREVLHSVDKGRLSTGTLRETLGGCADEVLAVRGLFFTMLDGEEYEFSVPRMLRLAPRNAALMQAAHAALDAKFVAAGLSVHDGFACLHVRRGDFDAMCGDLGEARWAQSLAEDGFSCEASDAQIRDFLAREKRPTLLISDTPTVLEQVEQESKELVLTSDFVDEVVRQRAPRMSSEMLTLLTGLVEQELCAQAAVVRLNKFSTFSSRIGELCALRAASTQTLCDVSYWRDR